MQRRILSAGAALALIAATRFACDAADFGKPADLSAVRALETTALRSEVPAVQRDVIAVTVSNLVVAGNFAVCQFSVGESAGYSVYARSGSTWKRISHGGEAPTKPSLQKLGVPATSIATLASHGAL
jgi:hypothetical protein